MECCVWIIACKDCSRDEASTALCNNELDCQRKGPHTTVRKLIAIPMQEKYFSSQAFKIPFCHKICSLRGFLMGADASVVQPLLKLISLGFGLWGEKMGRWGTLSQRRSEVIIRFLFWHGKTHGDSHSFLNYSCVSYAVCFFYCLHSIHKRLVIVLNYWQGFLFGDFFFYLTCYWNATGGCHCICCVILQFCCMIKNK